MNPPATGPGAPTTDGTDAATSRQLDEAEQKDSGRNFELIWIDATAGGSYVNMRQFSASTLSIDKTSAGGGAFSLGAGLRFVIFYVGARARYNALSAFDMWQFNAEAGLKIPVGSLDVLLGLHGGYSLVGGLDSVTGGANSSAASDAAPKGFNGGLDFALDYYVTKNFSIGGGILGDFLYLKRPQLDKPPGFSSLPAAEQQQITNSPLYKQSGTAAGLEVSGGLRLGLHFGL
jgi:hypothetical protein